jgi:serine/threonine protein kinase
MEERYEIRGKIGQGGLGAVYRGYDTRMNREIAIKRISVAGDDPALQEESTKQLIKEAGALASLQHPHIVTVYDVGSDEDGPYVVMELINGKTLDELIERAPLTWNDFREFALQTQEALIAAQELDLIHSDLKPSNLMLTWLPSGKFQIKIVDFGLATLTQSQSLEELEEIEAVFGSIFFMAPEQFERKPIDARVDMYAMGCVYYQALTGLYPFKGETGHDVMVSHLHHRVVPLQDVRSDIPLWACDWIMWHINRLPDDRPESARQALQVFLQNDKNPNPTMSLGRAQPAVPAGPRPRLAIPASTNVKRRVIDPRMAPPGYVPPPPPPEPEPTNVPEPPQTTTAPQPLMPPEGFKPSVHTGPHPIPDSLPVAATVPLNPAPYIAPTRPYVIPQRKKKSSMGPKIGIAAFLLIAIAAVGLLLSKRVKESTESQRGTVLLTQAADPATTEIPISGQELAGFLSDAANADTEAKRENIYQLLVKARPTDSTDFEATLTEFTTTSTQILPEVREALISKVLAPRMTTAMVAPLTDFARATNDPKSAVAAMLALKTWAGDEQFEGLLNVMQFSKNPDLRAAATENAVEIMRKSRKRDDLMKLVDRDLEGSSGAAREALEKVKAAAGR